MVLYKDKNMRKLSISLSVILLAVLLFGTGCTSKKSADARPVLAPHRTEIYFLIYGESGLVAFVPERSVSVGVKIQADVTSPYVEVPKIMIPNSFWSMSNNKEKEVIAWGYGGILYVKDLEQLKSLYLIK